ncbi:hypothetical protein V5O48_004355 [Marasmius crinis-equi]|uniref:Uncharacterized protein n=1 Tax=Marasmius crinis-equi TaxID=585013 RepID=A0ABR3FQB1_9AGAR
MSYSSQPHYLPPPPQQYYTSPPHLPHGQPAHNTTPAMRQETTAQRKRPKYTRSKTGCMTCRVKKIKPSSSIDHRVVYLARRRSGPKKENKFEKRFPRRKTFHGNIFGIGWLYPSYKG